MSTTTIPSTRGPRLHSLAVRNFQSLHNVVLVLETFTVIVGPSSSGKSALTRAIRTLVSNRRGTEWITHGERVASISASTDSGTVTLTRSRTTASQENSYTITPDGNSEDQRIYAKLGGDTPEDVSRFLGIAAGSTTSPPINFAGQFDKPFLLDDSAAEVARTLGSLTNVNIIFEAARESNRRKLNTSGTLKLRAQDLQAVKDRIPEFKALRAQDDALALAEAQVASSRLLGARIAKLEAALDTIEAADTLIAFLTPLATLVVPTSDDARQAHTALTSFQAALARVPAAQRAVQDASGALDGIETEEQYLLREYEQLTEQAVADIRGFFDVRMDNHYTYPVDGATYVEVGHAVDIFLKFLETKAGS